MEQVKTAVAINNLSKKFKGFTLDIPCLKIPQGFATALIGENGAGKTTLLNALAGVRLDYKGNMDFFGKWDDKDRENADCPVKEMIGYVGPNNYYLPHWTVKQVEEITDLLYDKFDRAKFERYLQQLQIVTTDHKGGGKKVNDLSDGNRMKLMLSGVFARETQMLLLDEPASPLDPLMRDVLCDMIRGYLEEGAGEKTVLFSTHNIADMENVTDYAIIVEHGQVVEKGFVEDLKEKYVYVKGELKDVSMAEKFMYSMTKNNYGYEGICLAEDMDKLAGLDIVVETPTLSQISVAVMKKSSKVQLA